jgi:hypothetical protein
VIAADTKYGLAPTLTTIRSKPENPVLPLQQPVPRAVYSFRSLFLPNCRGCFVADGTENGF